MNSSCGVDELSLYQDGFSFDLFTVQLAKMRGLPRRHHILKNYWNLMRSTLSVLYNHPRQEYDLRVVNVTGYILIIEENFTFNISVVGQYIFTCWLGCDLCPYFHKLLIDNFQTRFLILSWQKRQRSAPHLHFDQYIQKQPEHMTIPFIKWFWWDSCCPIYPKTISLK